MFHAWFAEYIKSNQMSEVCGLPVIHQYNQPSNQSKVWGMRSASITSIEPTLKLVKGLMKYLGCRAACNISIQPNLKLII